MNAIAAGHKLAFQESRAVKTRDSYSVVDGNIHERVWQDQGRLKTDLPFGKIDLLQPHK